MFSGIVEEMAEIIAIERYKENIDFVLKCSFSNELKIDQSIAHNGVCLTVVRLQDDTYTVTAMKETFKQVKSWFIKGWRSCKYRAFYVNEWPIRWSYRSRSCR